MAAGGPVASLGELAQRAGLLDAAGTERLVLELRERLRAGRPMSLGALLLERGIPTDRVLALAAAGAACSAMRCDVCATAYPLGAFPPAREFPCTRCGAKVLAFGQGSRPGIARSGEDARAIVAPASPASIPAVHSMPGGGVALAIPATPDGAAN
ncbi:hypothetical protein HY251_10785 [bacterium]|nr:hypothetical protein [bacterium]